ncbi:CRTAC1 family protein [Nevskia soli]|uniref:CRTAC1 family protein n=1 Tax=Nevskia soli TaxID=418856 RepID=UPI0015D8479E|nr:CRTAC1 family protein [Nevskia soli]
MYSTLRAAAVVSTAVLIAVIAAAAISETASSPFHFSLSRLPFKLENDETAPRHTPATMAGGVAIFDYNRDGRPDIFFTNGANIATLKKDDPKYSNRLFRNDGNGKFTDVTVEAGLAGTGFDMGAAVGDYDNDGCPDLFVAGVHHSTLYHNNCNGTFTDVTDEAGGFNLPDPEIGPLWAVTAAWVDVNNDGLLDLFVGNYTRWNYNHDPRCFHGDQDEYCTPEKYDRTPSRLFLNKGNGKFEDVSEQWGLHSKPGRAMGVGIADYDLDGRPDIFVTNDVYYNYLYHNTGSKFEEVAFPMGVALPEDGNFVAGMGLDFRDYNNDGYPDLSYVTLTKQSFPLLMNVQGREFRDVTTPTGIRALTLPMAGFGSAFYDLDNDGWKDIFVTRGDVLSLPFPGTVINQLNTAFRNPGASGKWQAYTEEAGFGAAQPGRNRGCAFGDLDGDGRIDIVATALSQPAQIWMNRSPSGHWLDIALEGVKSNRDGIGATVKLTSKSGAQYNHMTTSVCYASSSAGPVHFGLGPDTKADSIEVHWPAGGTQTLHDVAADRTINVKETAR